MISNSWSFLELKATWIAQVLWAFYIIPTPLSKSVANCKTSLKTYIHGIPNSDTLPLSPHNLSPIPTSYEYPAKLPTIPTQPKFANSIDPGNVKL